MVQTRGEPRPGRRRRHPERPLLLVPYSRYSFTPFEIAEAVDDLADICWVIERRDAVVDLWRLLERIGPVVAREQRDLDAVAAELAADEPAGIVTFSHQDLLATAGLAARLGLAYNSTTATLRCVDKFAERAALAAAGIPTPAFQALEISGGKWERVAGDAMTFPAVLKPRAGAGSVNTCFVPDAGALDDIVASARVPDGRYVLEGFLAGAPAPSPDVGDYVSVESLLRAGVAEHLEVTGKFPLVPPFRETGNFQPHALEPATHAAVLALVDGVLGGLGLSEGVVHTEIKLTADGPRLIEVNPRVGGGGITNIFERRHGISLIRIAVLAALGAPPPLSAPTDGVAYNFYVMPPAGAARLLGVDGVDQVSRLPGVDHVELHRGIGEALDWHEGSLGYVATVGGYAADHAAVFATHAAVLDTLQLHCDDGTRVGAARPGVAAVA